MKYIDADKLIAEVERRLKIVEHHKDTFESAAACRQELIWMKEFITSLQQEQPIKVYRVENEKEQKGLWRKFDGTWEPLFDMLTDGQCKDMPMGDSPIYREGGKQWFASAPSKETLQKWFSKKDLEELTAKGFTISEFEVVGHKKVSDFEYIFTRDSIIGRTYLKVSDIYPQEQPDKYETALEKAREWMPNVNQGGHSILIDIFPELGEGLDPRYGSRKQEQPEVDLVAELKRHLATTPKEQLEKEWKELEPWNNIGPTVQEFLYGKQPEVDLEEEISNYMKIHHLHIKDGGRIVFDNDDSPNFMCDIRDIARHFWNKGYNARKEE